MEYTFDKLSLSPLPAGTNVLVTGDSMGGLGSVFYQLLGVGYDQGVGTALVSTTADGRAALRNLEQIAGEIDTSLVGVIDYADDSDHPCVRSVGSPEDLTGMSMQLSKLYEGFSRQGVDRVQTGFHSISTLLTYLDTKTVFRFLHTLTGNVAAMDGLGLYALSPSAHEEQATNQLTQLFDGRIEVDLEDDGTLLVRVRGFEDQQEEWTVLQNRTLDLHERG